VTSSAPQTLRVEHLGAAALGVGTARPRLSWVLPEGCREQLRYTIEIDGRACDPVESSASVLVPWPGPALSSRQRASWRVALTTDCGESPWSEPAWVETGLLDEADWVAAMISPPVPPGSTALLRREFHLPSGAVRARLHLTALGVLEAEIGGRRVGDHVLDPGWTSYHHRLRYRTFDVTDLLIPGSNVLAARLADGWYRGRLGLTGGGGYPCVYGDRLGLLAQLEAELSDGTRVVVATDDSWTWHPGPTTRSSLYDGEEHNARAELPGWSSGAVGGWWRPVDVLDHDMSTLVAATGPPVRVTDVVEPIAVVTSPSGRTIVDFGQNLAGRVRLDVRGPSGAEVVVRHAEILEHGELCT
jgi:alpha-L-rhamnosidase